jgi:hypothetical protein
MLGGPTRVCVSLPPSLTLRGPSLTCLPILVLCTAGGTPFNIITGRGLHSEQARAVLRPNISKMLKVNGWRVSEGTEGTLRVIGKA